MRYNPHRRFTLKYRISLVYFFIFLLAGSMYVEFHRSTFTGVYLSLFERFDGRAKGVVVSYRERLLDARPGSKRFDVEYEYMAEGVHCFSNYYSVKTMVLKKVDLDRYPINSVVDVYYPKEKPCLGVLKLESLDASVLVDYLLILLFSTLVSIRF